MVKSSKKLFLALFTALIMLCACFSLGNFTTVKANTLPTFTMDVGASVRLVGTDKTQNGIRFTAVMSESDYNTFKGSYGEVKFGIAIIPADYALNYPITKDNLFGQNAVYVSNMSASQAIAQGKRAMVVGESQSLTKDGSVYVLNVAMTNFITSNISREFIGTPYFAYKTEGATEFSYELGNYYGGDISNNTRSMAFVAQKAIEAGKDTNGTLYDTYINDMVVGSIKSDYTVNYYFDNGNGEYVKEPTFTQILSGVVNSKIDLSAITSKYAIRDNAFTLNQELSTSSAIVYANGKTQIDFYYDLNLTGGSVYFGFPDDLYEAGALITNLTDGSVDNIVWTKDYPCTTSFIAADFGYVDTITGIKIKHQANSDVWFGANVEYSVDGKNFVKAGVVTDADGANGVTEIVFDGLVKARFIRLTHGDRNLSTWIKVAEIEKCSAISIDQGLTLSEGVLANIIDGDKESFAWVHKGANENYEGMAVTLDLGRETAIYDVNIYMAKAGSEADYFHTVTLQYQDVTTNEWIDLCTQRASEVRYVLPCGDGVTARYVRAVAGSQTTNWVVIREFTVNEYVVGIQEGPGLSAEWSSDADGYVSAVDGNEKSFIAFSKSTSSETGHYLIFDLRSVQDIYSVYIKTGGYEGESLVDTITNGKILYSIDNEDYEVLSDIGMSDGVYDILLGAPIKARYIKFDFENIGHWARLLEFKVNANFPISFGSSFDNKTNENGLNHISNICDGNYDTYLWFVRSGDYNGRTVTLNLDGETSINNVFVANVVIDANATAETGRYRDAFVFGGVEYSTDGVHFITLSSENYTVANDGDIVRITLNNSVIAKYIRLTDSGNGWLAISEIGVNA